MNLARKRLDLTPAHAATTRAAVAFAIVLSALSVLMSAQIPESAQWEITFARVEAAARLPDLRTAGADTFEARVMQRPWSAIAPVPFLRLSRHDGVVRAQLFVFWDPNRYPPGRQPGGLGMVCREGVCVRPIDITEQREWGDVVATLAAHNVCAPATQNHVRVCADCDQMWIKTATVGRYREQSCADPDSDTTVGSLLQLMKRSARAAGY